MIEEISMYNAFAWIYFKLASITYDVTITMSMATTWPRSGFSVEVRGANSCKISKYKYYFFARLICTLKINLKGTL